MVNLFDIARQAQSGTWLDAMSRQLQLDPAQTQRGVEALLPAFSLAFQRAAMNPSTFADLLGMVGSGQFAPFYDASNSPRPTSGDTVLNQLFGSKLVEQAVAAQASRMTGIGIQALHDMMPALAATLIGGMFRYASVEGFADFLRQCSDAIKAAHPPAKPAPSDPWSAWAETVGAMMGASPKKPTPPDPIAAWNKMMATALGGNGKTLPSPPPSEPNPFEAVSRMFESGAQVQSQYLAQLQTILDGFWSTADTSRAGQARR